MTEYLYKLAAVPKYVGVCSLTRRTGGKTVIVVNRRAKIGGGGGKMTMTKLHGRKPRRHAIVDNRPLCGGLGDFLAGRFALELNNVRRFEDPIRARGHQLWWNHDIDLDDVSWHAEAWRAAP
jgi:hypothetical protein